MKTEILPSTPETLKVGKVKEATPEEVYQYFLKRFTDLLK